ncbi:MAG: efflux RND transporter periplasmic adaptor subunit [Bryobacteraceae bacterium]
MRTSIAPVFPLLLAAWGSFLLSSCGGNKDGQAGAAAASEIPTVAVAKAATATLSRDLILTAEFKPYQEVDVMAKVSGYVKEIRVDVGDRVKEGDLLATLEVPEMADDLRKSQAGVRHSQSEVARAQDEIARAKSAHDIAHLSYDRLFQASQKKPGLIAQQEIDDAQSKDLGAEAQLAAANSALAAARQQVDVDQSSTARVQTMIDYERVIAPFAGVVTKRYADQGSMIQAGTASQTQAMPVVRISENGLLRLILPVPESAVPTVHIGQQVEVRVAALNRAFPGKVARFVDKLSLETRTMDTEVDVPNADLVLIPGMYAEVTLTLSRRNSVLTIPITAVDVDAETASQNGASDAPAAGRVMVITPTSHVEVRKISLGLETANQVEVRSGLNEGDMVVIGSRSGLEPGVEVKPQVTVIAGSKQ